MEVLEVLRVGTEWELFDELATPQHVLEELCATMPFARLHLSERQDRMTNDALRAAFALMWRETQRVHIVLYTERPLMMLPDCRSCGLGTGNYCDRCTGPLCTACEEDTALCPECRLG